MSALSKVCGCIGALSEVCSFVLEVCFRLEERKGIKVFVEAVSRLQPESVDKRCVLQSCLVPT